MNKAKNYLVIMLTVILIFLGMSGNVLKTFAMEQEDLPKVEISLDDINRGIVRFKASSGTDEATLSGGDVNPDTLPDRNYYVNFLVTCDNKYVYIDARQMGNNKSALYLLPYMKYDGIYKIQAYLTDGHGEAFHPNASNIVTAEFEYTRPDKTLAAPKNINWSKDTEGLLIWDAVEDAYCYSGSIFKDGHFIGVFSNVFETAVDISAYMKESGVYTVGVKPQSNDIFTLNDGLETMSEPYIKGGNNNQINSSLNDIMEQLNGIDSSNQEALTANKDVIADAVKKLVENNTLEDLNIAMQTDSDMLPKLAALEELYTKSNQVNVNIQVSQDVTDRMDPNKITITGAGLNGSFGENIQFHVNKILNNTSVELDRDRFANAYTLDLNLGGVKLRVPVQITMPIPSGLDPRKMVLFHYCEKDGQLSVDKLIPQIDYDKNTASFWVTSFSSFVFAEDIEKDSTEDDNQNSNNIPDTSFGWEPTTENEKYRFSFKTTLPISYQAYSIDGYDVAITSEVQGEKWFDVLETILGKYQIGTTYNIYLDGQKLYQSQNPIKVTLQIPASLSVDGRSYAMICVGENGVPYIYNDEDSDNSTITFTADKFYAYGLCYLN